MLRVWNLSLVCSTFALTILGTFLTRSGVIQSVHAFSTSQIGPWILTFFGIIAAVSIGLIGWRGDSLRSPGSIDSPLSREGSFLANNVLFGVFAFIVLLGTVFPLIVEAVNGDKLSVGGPYFDRMSTPIGLALLFLMAVAPVLPWRKTKTEVLADRLRWPLAAAVAVVVVCVIGGLRGVTPLLTFSLGALAAGAALRQLILAARASRRRGGSIFGALVGRANGGMIVHLGVVLIAIGIAASGSYSTARELTFKPNQTQVVAGHSVQYLGPRQVTLSGGRTRLTARLRVDGGRIDEPALTSFGSGDAVGTPSVKTGWREDVYLQLITAPIDVNGRAIVAVFVKPLIVWLWIGGLLMAVGTGLAIVPGRRRNPVDPVSQDVAVAVGALS